MKLRKYVCKNNVRLIHAMGCNDFPLAREVGKRVGIAVTVQVRWPRERDYCAWMFGKDPKPARMLCVTEAMVRYEQPIMQGLLPAEHVVAVHNGLDMEQFCPRPAGRRSHWRGEWGVPEEAFCIGVAGVIQERKQTIDLIDVVASLRDRGVDAWGVIAGGVDDEEYAHEIVERIGELGDAVRIVCAGHVDDIADAYSGFDITASFARIETFGMSVAESIACGCPVVYYQIEVLDEVAGPGGVPVPMGAVESFAEACAQLAASPSDQATLRKAGMAHVRSKFSAEASTKALACVVGDVLSDADAAKSNGGAQ
ncbi:MAG: glycosyltransferase family 4 protein [Planctomycetota bacterium]